MATDVVLNGAGLWQDFLSSLGQQVALVGPLQSAPPTTTGPTIFVDGGARWYRPPGITIGDGDSLGQPPQVHLRADKDISDLGFALRALPPRVRLLEMLGFLGGDRDHEWFNLGEIEHFLAHQRGRVVHLDQALMGFSRGHWQFEHVGGFSLLSLRPSQIELDGDIDFKVLTATDFRILDSRGLSNRAEGLVTLRSTEPVFVFFKDPLAAGKS